MSIAFVVILIISNIVFLFLGLLAGYYIYGSHGNIENPNPFQLIQRAGVRNKIMAIKSPTAEEQSRRGSREEAEEKEMESLLEKIIPVPKKK